MFPLANQRLAYNGPIVSRFTGRLGSVTITCVLSQSEDIFVFPLAIRRLAYCGPIVSRFTERLGCVIIIFGFLFSLSNL